MSTIAERLEIAASSLEASGASLAIAVVTAEGHATTATTKAGEALASANAASASEGNALAYRNTASGYATPATTKAGEASDSATTANTKASIATTKAGEAVDSAATATTKAAEALASANAAVAAVGAFLISVMAGEGLTAGNLVSWYTVGGVLKARLADNTAAGKEADGFVLDTVSTGAMVNVHGSGLITGLSGLTPDAFYLLGTAGHLTIFSSPPTTTGNVYQRVGKALSATTLFFQRNPPATLVVLT